MSYFGVITGDIVASRQVKQEQYDTLLYTLKQTLAFLSDYDGARYDVFRGDSFQIIFPQPQDAIEAAILIRLALKTKGGFEVRQSVGLGTIDQQRNDLSSSTGQAFNLSGLGLDLLKNQQLAVFSDNEKFQRHFELLTRFLDSTLSGLTSTQALVLYEYLTVDDRSHQAIANNLNKSRVNTTKILNSANYQLIDSYIQQYRTLTLECFNNG
ncbi:MAG: hypothetical protein HRU24_10845 [Gammaproteobacteria bacterium]|nr:hypothetical protein [Gammaproteobacteria bacterium]